VVIEHIDHVTGRVKTVKAHGFEDGQFISFSELNGACDVPLSMLLNSVLHRVLTQFSFGAHSMSCHLAENKVLEIVPKVAIKRIYKTTKSINPKTQKEQTRSVQIFDCFQIDLDSLNEQLKVLGQAPLASMCTTG